MEFDHSHCNINSRAGHKRGDKPAVVESRHTTTTYDTQGLPYKDLSSHHQPLSTDRFYHQPMTVGEQSPNEQLWEITSKWLPTPPPHAFALQSLLSCQRF